MYKNGYNFEEDFIYINIILSIFYPQTFSPKKKIIEIIEAEDLQKMKKIFQKQIFYQKQTIQEDFFMMGQQ